MSRPLGTTELARVARLLAEPTRAAFCLSLLDGRAWTAGELARHVGVAPSTASEHLHRLVAGGLLITQRQGRHRYHRLADPEVARLLEELAGRHAPAPRPAGSLRVAVADAALVRGRTCYDHLAGRLGVSIAAALVRSGRLAADLSPTPTGREWLAELAGEDLTGGAGRPLTRSCLDWTERRPHLGGRGGAALCRYLFEAGFVARIGSERAVRLTPAGTAALPDIVGLDPTGL